MADTLTRRFTLRYANHIVLQFIGRQVPISSILHVPCGLNPANVCPSLLFRLRDFFSFVGLRG